MNRGVKVLQTFALPLGYGTEPYAHAEAAWAYHLFGAVDGIRTRDIHLGKVALYH